MRILRIALVILAVSMITSCMTIPESQGSNLTVGMVKTKIIKGSTTQAEILQIFGAPNIITKNRSDDEVWNYNRMSFQSFTDVSGGIIINWFGSRSVSTATTKSFDLIIVFNEKDKVKDYSVISAIF